MREPFALMALLLAISGCGPGGGDPPPSNNPFADAIGRAIQPRDEYERADALETAIDLVTSGAVAPASTCPSIDRLAAPAEAFEELDGRRAIVLFGLVPCSSAGEALRRAALGLWLAGSGISRALAVQALGAGADMNLWASVDVPALTEDLTSSTSPEARLSAYLYLYTHADESDAALVLRRALRDESSLVRSGMPSVEVTDAVP